MYDITAIAVHRGHCGGRDLQRSGRELFITQPSLTKMVRELEKEMNIQIFERTNKGVHLSRDGEIFLGYARQVLEQADLLETRYKKKPGKTGIHCFHPALFVCRECLCRPDQGIWGRHLRFQPAGDPDLYHHR